MNTSHKAITVFVGGTSPFADNKGNAAIFVGLLKFLEKTSKYGYYIIKCYVAHTLPESIHRYIIFAPSIRIPQSWHGRIYVVPPKSFYIRFSKHVIIASLIYQILYIIDAALAKVLKKVGVNYKPFTSMTRALLESDIVLEFNWGDTFTDKYYGFLVLAFNVTRMVSYKILDKPTVLMPQSLGPFNTLLGKSLARIILSSKNIKLIFPREPVSYANMISLGIPKVKIFLAPDISSYIMLSMRKPVSNENAKRRLLNVCVAPNPIFIQFYGIKHFNHLLSCIISSVKRLQRIRKLFNVYLISHGSSISKFFDTLKLCKMLSKITGFHIVRDDMIDVVELWDNISQRCDVMISMLAHPIMASLYSGKPAIGLSYSKKIYGILKMFGLSELIVEPLAECQSIGGKIQQVIDNYEEYCKALNTKLKLFRKLNRRLEELFVKVVGEQSEE